MINHTLVRLGITEEELDSFEPIVEDGFIEMFIADKKLYNKLPEARDYCLIMFDEYAFNKFKKEYKYEVPRITVNVVSATDTTQL